MNLATGEAVEFHMYHHAGESLPSACTSAGTVLLTGMLFFSDAARTGVTF